MTLRGSVRPLVQEYDVALLDLDGVVYVGPHAVPGAGAAIAAVRQAGMRVAFVTNNASRTPAAVAEHLTALGIPARPAEIITAAQSAAHWLADKLPAGAPVLVIGAAALAEAVRERGLTPVASADDGPAAVVQGYSPRADWAMLAEATVAVRNGAIWVASNADATLPSPRGPLPGNGSLVAAVATATGRRPEAVTGKPAPTMHREMVERSDARRPLVIGDRLDTDVEGAEAAGCDSLLVLTGVTDPAALVHAPQGRRPTFVARGLAALTEPQPEIVARGDDVRCGAWSVGRRAGGLVVSRAGADGDPLDALRAVASAAWRWAATEVEAVDEQAAKALGELGLA